MSQIDLNELRVLDTAPKGMTEFLAKYRKIARGKPYEITDLYVHFSNHRESTMDKSMVSSPDHSDPQGLYTYPMDYVLKHPADLWYGLNTRYLHVVRATGKGNTLYMRDIESNEDISRIIRRMGIPEPNYDKVRRAFGYTGRWRFAKTFMMAFQIKWDELTPEEIKDRRWKTRSAVEQSRLLQKAGYDSMWDTNTGAINDREPEQRVFLTKPSFKIIDMFLMRTPRGINQKDAKDPQKLSRAMSDTGHGNMVTAEKGEITVRKIAALSAQAVQDQLVNGKYDKMTHGKGMFWTKKGYEIKVDISDSSLQRRMDTLKMGQKGHRWHKSFDGYVANITISTPHGEITGHIGSDEKYQDTMQRIASKWYRMQEEPIDPNWSEQNPEKFEKRMKRDKEMGSWNYWRKERGLPALSSEEFDQLEAEGKTLFGEYNRDMADKKRHEMGLPVFRNDQYSLYYKGKIPLDASPFVGGSQASYDRLGRALNKRLVRTKNDEPVDPDFARDLYHLGKGKSRFGGTFGPRSLPAINAMRAKSDRPLMTPAQFERYKQNPSKWRLDSYHMEPFGESKEDEMSRQDKIHTKTLDDTGYWGKRGAGALIMAQDTGRFLLAFRSKQVEEPHTWGTWGGAIDGNEDPITAVVREVKEECGCTNIIKAYPAYEYHDDPFVFYNFIVIVPTEFKPRLDWENEGARWVKFGEWPETLHYGLRALLDDPKSLNLMRNLLTSHSDDLTESPQQRVASAVFYAEDTDKYLFVRRSKHEDSNVGDWEFPGGKIDTGETWQDGLRRELREELNYRKMIPELKDLKKHEWMRKVTAAVDYRAYLIKVESEFRPILNKEHDLHRWVEWKKWPQPLRPELKKSLLVDKFRNRLEDLSEEEILFRLMNDLPLNS